MMHEALGSLLDETVVVYVDEILLFSRSIAEGAHLGKSSEGCCRQVEASANLIGNWCSFMILSCLSKVSSQVRRESRHRLSGKLL